MILIERLGGYERAKAEFRDNGSLHAERLKTALLDYRRQHNIFEVGDKVVAIGEDYLSTVMTVERITGGALECFESVYIFTFQGVRHATDAEIKAGKRLEVK